MVLYECAFIGNKICLTKIHLLLFFSAPASIFASEKGKQKPTIVVVKTDDQGIGDPACMGNRRVKTPNLDKSYTVHPAYYEYIEKL